MTSFFAIKDDLVHAGATWVDQEVVVGLWIAEGIAHWAWLKAEGSKFKALSS